MSIRDKAQNNKISKSQVFNNTCRTVNETIVFSFTYMCQNSNYNFNYFSKAKSEAVNGMVQFIEKLKLFSMMTWEDLKKQGLDKIPIHELDKKFVNGTDKLKNKDDYILSFKFNGQNSRFFAIRGTKCGRVMHILGIDYRLQAYDHE